MPVNLILTVTISMFTCGNQYITFMDTNVDTGLLNYNIILGTRFWCSCYQYKYQQLVFRPHSDILTVTDIDQLCKQYQKIISGYLLSIKILIIMSSWVICASVGNKCINYFIFLCEAYEVGWDFVFHLQGFEIFTNKPGNSNLHIQVIFFMLQAQNSPMIPCTYHSIMNILR